MALELGKTIEEIMRTMSTAEMLAWLNYYNQRPFGYLRTELREAFNCSVMSAPYRKKDVDIKEFMMFKPQEELPKTADLVEKVKGMFFGMIDAQQRLKGK